MDELALLDRLQPILEEGKPARSLELNEDEQILMKGYNLLTAKPMIYVANLDDEGIMDPDSCAYYNQVKEYAKARITRLLPYVRKWKKNCLV